MMWAQGSQLSGDTITLQMKNKKLDNMQLYPSAFTVNVEKNDSTHFNQVGGKRMRGYFRDNKLSWLFVEGNAESIYFARDSTNKLTGMQRSLSSKLRVNFKDNKANTLTFIGKPENRYTPIEKVKEDDKLLKAFIWKPKDRPVSKEAIIPSLRRHSGAERKTAGKAVPGKVPPGKPSAAKTLGVKPATNSAKIDTTAKAPSPAKVKTDTARKAAPPKPGVRQQ